jgi:hypothetical protein
MIAQFPNQLVEVKGKPTPRVSERRDKRGKPVKQEITNPLHSQPIYDRFKAAKKNFVEAKKLGEVPTAISKELEWAKGTYFRLLTEAKETGKITTGGQVPTGADKALNEQVNEASANNYKEYQRLVPKLWADSAPGGAGTPRGEDPGVPAKAGNGTEKSENPKTPSPSVAQTPVANANGGPRSTPERDPAYAGNSRASKKDLQPTPKPVADDQSGDKKMSHAELVGTLLAGIATK